MLRSVILLLALALVALSAHALDKAHDLNQSAKGFAGAAKALREKEQRRAGYGGGDEEDDSAPSRGGLVGGAKEYASRAKQLRVASETVCCVQSVDLTSALEARKDALEELRALSFTAQCETSCSGNGLEFLSQAKHGFTASCTSGKVSNMHLKVPVGTGSVKNVKVDVSGSCTEGGILGLMASSCCEDGGKKQCCLSNSGYEAALAKFRQAEDDVQTAAAKKVKVGCKPRGECTRAKGVSMQDNATNDVKAYGKCPKHMSMSGMNHMKLVFDGVDISLKSDGSCRSTFGTDCCSGVTEN